MTNSYCKAYSEVNAILNLSNYFKSKVPQKFIDMIEREQDLNYKPQISKDIPLEEQSLMKETQNILAYLKLNCWCTEEEKKEFVLMLGENQKKNEEVKVEEYKSTDIFKNNNVEEEQRDNKKEVNNLPMNVEKDSIFKRIFNFVRNIILSKNK